jgi:4-hydroxy-tetrahydrodipicolinate synthase
LGDDALAFPMYAVGARGVISVSSNVAPREMSQMWDYARDGKWAEARELHFRLRVLNHLLFVESNPTPVKAALAALGRIADEVRLPLVTASAPLAAQLRAELATLGFIK